MAQDRKVIAGWSFNFFRSKFGEVRRPEFVNSENNTTFTKLAFQRENGTFCFVGWSDTLGGELTDEELIAQRDTLRIVQLEVSEEERQARKEKGLQEETYKICRQGDSTWRKVNI